MALILLNLALAAPTDPAELADAAIEAEGVLASCRRAVEAGVPCSAGRRQLAQASLVQALASLVVEGAPDPRAAADAWALDPTVAGQWSELIGPAGVEPSAWVVQLVTPTAPPEPPQTPAPERRVAADPPVPTSPQKWWSVALQASLAPWSDQPMVRGQQHIRMQAAAGTGLLAGMLELDLGRDLLDMTPLLPGRGAEIQGDGVIVTPDDGRQWLRQGRLFLAAGPGWTRTHHLRVLLGPTLGSSGFSPATIRTLEVEHGLRPSPAPVHTGFELRARGRLQRGRVAGVLEARSAYEWTIYRAGYLIAGHDPIDRDDVQDTKRTLRNTALTELQVRLVRDLWWTVGARATLATRVRRPNTTHQIDGLFAESGLAWR